MNKGDIFHNVIVAMPKILYNVSCGEAYKLALPYSIQ